MIVALLVKAFAISILGVAASQLAHRCRASVRHAILLAMFGAMATLPIATYGLPSLDVAVAVSVTANSGGAQHVRPGGQQFAPGAESIRADRSQPVGAGRPTPIIDLEALVLLAWLAGATLFLASLVLGTLRLQRLRRTALPAAGIAGQQGLVARRVDLLIHESLTAPIAVGILHPAIILPRDATEWSAAALQRALIHELEHIRRHDWVAQLFARVVCAVCWFNPFAWMAYRRLTLNAECACDDAVMCHRTANPQTLTTSEEGPVYADQLVTLARRMNARAQSAVLGMAQRSDLAARVQAVLDASRVRGRAGARRALVIAAAATLVVMTVAPLRIVAAPVAPLDGTAVAAGNSTNESERQQRRVSGRDRALLEAIDNGDMQEVRELLDDGANVNAAVDGDGSPLIIAAREGHLAIVQLLLERGADVNLAVPGDGAPLIMAAREGHLEIAQLLLDHGAKVDMGVAGDENALIQASGAGHLEVVKLLVSRGANVNTRVIVELPYDAVMTDKDGIARAYRVSRRQLRTPLWQARRGGHAAVADFLRASGAVE